MKHISKILARLRRLTDAIMRYPLTTAFLVADAVLIALSIETDHNYDKYILSIAVGAVLSAAMQAAFERFFIKGSARFWLFASSLVLAAGYFLIINSAPEVGIETEIRTAVTLFALMIAFIWVPVIKSCVTFNESFMAAFKALFQSGFYATILYGGIILIISAIDRLIAPVDSDYFGHTANIVYVLFAPILFLSKIPLYPGKSILKDPESADAGDERLKAAASCPKFLEVLISYIIIPLTAVFTVVLIIYIAINITGEFWTNNLLEPMLISYAITVLLVYVLASRLENRFAYLFRLIFPKLLVPIVIFQIASSILSTQDTGLTYSRYFVIIFGVFAASAGVVLPIVPVRKNGIIAAMLIVFAAISITPPVDAFSVSRHSQQTLLYETLNRNGMLSNASGKIIPKSDIPDKDKKRIVNAVDYLYRMDYTKTDPLFPPDFDAYEDFYDTFGFEKYALDKDNGRYMFLALDPTESIDISGYDYLVQSYTRKGEIESQRIQTADGRTLVLTQTSDGPHYVIALGYDTGEALISINTAQIYERFKDLGSQKQELTQAEAAFTAQTESAKLKLVVQNMSISITDDGLYYDAAFYIMIKLD